LIFSEKSSGIQKYVNNTLRRCPILKSLIFLESACLSGSIDVPILIFQQLSKFNDFTVFSEVGWENQNYLPNGRRKNFEILVKWY
jgi:hypothetical protein